MMVLIWRGILENRVVATIDTSGGDAPVLVLLKFLVQCIG